MNSSVIDRWIRKHKRKKGYSTEVFSMVDINYALRLAKKEIKQNLVGKFPLAHKSEGGKA